MAKKTGLILSLAVGSIVLASAAGYGIYAAMGQSDSNDQNLEQFGFNVLPSGGGAAGRTTNTGEESFGVLGQRQVNATFQEDSKTPTEKVIKSLREENKRLLVKIDTQQQEQKALKDQIAALEEYKRLNQHFAPDSIGEELRKVKAQLKRYLLNSPEASRFNNRQVESVSIAATHEYEKFVRRNRIILSDFQREEVVSIYLPEYAFCMGDGIELAANTPSEERALITFFETNDADTLSPALMNDLRTILKPCQESLYDNLAVYEPSKKNG